MQPLDRREFIAALGGAAAVSLMSHEAGADALEDALMADGAPAPAVAAGTAAKYPTVAELEAQVPDLPRRRGTGSILFAADTDAGKLPLLPKLPLDQPCRTSSPHASTSRRTTACRAPRWQ